MNYFLAVSLLAPFLGSILIGVFDSHLNRRVTILTSLLFSLASLVVARPHAHVGWWSSDPLGWYLALSSLFTGACVGQYAARQFAQEQRGRSYAATALGVVGCVVSTDLSGTTLTLTVSWVMTSVLTVALLRRGALAHGAAANWRRASLTLLAGDAVLVASFLMAAGSPHAPSAVSPWSGRFHGVGALVLVAGAMIAASARAGLTLRRSWVTDTITAPTATSALLHAGVVNAGALLIFRAQSLAGPATLLCIALATSCFVVLVILAPRIHARVDLKGQLAASTVAQMSFMLMALALGYPLLAFTHAVGHGIYKAGRFMSAGAAIEQRAQLRRRLRTGTSLSRSTRSLAALGIVAFAVTWATLLGGDAPAVMGIFAPAVVVVWWSNSHAAPRGSFAIWCALVATLLVYGAIVALLGDLLALAHYVSAWRAPWWSLGAVVLTLAVATTRGRSPSSRRSTTEETTDGTQARHEMAVVA